MHGGNQWRRVKVRFDFAQIKQNALYILTSLLDAATLVTNAWAFRVISSKVQFTFLDLLLGAIMFQWNCPLHEVQCKSLLLRNNNNKKQPNKILLSRKAYTTWRCNGIGHRSSIPPPREVAHAHAKCAPVRARSDSDLTVNQSKPRISSSIHSYRGQAIDQWCIALRGCGSGIARHSFRHLVAIALTTTGRTVSIIRLNDSIINNENDESSGVR